MNFHWADVQIGDDELAQIEVNIQNEIDGLEGIAEQDLTHWTAHLTEDRLNQKLIGFVSDLNDETRVHFTYSLVDNHFAEYKLI